MFPAVAPKLVPVTVTFANVLAGKLAGMIAVTVGNAIPAYVPADGWDETPLIETVKRTRVLTATSVKTVQVIETAVNHAGLEHVEPEPVAPYDTTGNTVLVPKLTPTIVTTVAVAA